MTPSGSSDSPVQRHWHHCEELRHLYQSMPAGKPRERVEARWQAAVADHRQMVQETEAQPRS